MARPADTILQVRESFVSGTTAFRKGELVAADHPIVKKLPQHFEPVTIHHPAPSDKPVEAATAAPGEKRGR